MEFPTPEARKDYLKEHPHADPSNHTVKKKEEHETKEEDDKPKSKAPALFSPKEVEKLSDTASQPTGDPDKLFEGAKVAFEQQLKWLNQGAGLDKTIGAKVVRADKEGGGEVDYDQPGPIIVIGPMKKRERAEEKVKSDYGGDWSRVGDLVRASVAVDSFDDIESTLDKLRASGLKLARKPKDRFAHPTESGYRDLMLNVVYPNGHVGELQMHLKPILKVKSEGHKLYEGVRSIEAKAKAEHRDKLTDEEMHTVEEANKKAKELYEGAWEKATSPKGEKTKEASYSYDRRAAYSYNRRMAARPKKFYEYNGLPSYWEGNNFPRVITPKREKTVYELEDFFNKAMPISEERFKRMEEKTRKN